MVQQEEPRSLTQIYACCDDILQPYVHKGHDMKLPLYMSTKNYMIHGVLLWGASAQEAPTKDIQHDYRRGFIKFLSHESICLVTFTMQSKLLLTMVSIIFLTTLLDL